MDYFAQQLINGIVLGSIYGLIAIGYTMVYGIVGMINFAHGDIFMIGGFIALISFLVLVSFGLTAGAGVLLFVLFVSLAGTPPLRPARGGHPHPPPRPSLPPAPPRSAPPPSLPLSPLFPT